MSEKQASSEIAQRRERFEAKFPELTLSRYVHDGSYVNPHTRDRWEGWEAAERDTREHVAQIADELARQHDDGNAYGGPITKVLNQLAERIRGKE